LRPPSTSAGALTAIGNNSSGPAGISFCGSVGYAYPKLPLYEKLLTLKITDDDGNVLERERRTTVNHAMKSCRRAWNVCSRRNPGKVPLVNPFAKMGLQGSKRETPTATFEDLVTFRTKAVELGLSSLATAALIGWEWLQREADIFATFDVTHYRPKEHPNMVRVVDEKTRAESWIPLFDDAGALLYPELWPSWTRSSATELAA
jgi:hypothetical protein